VRVATRPDRETAGPAGVGRTPTPAAAAPSAGRRPRPRLRRLGHRLSPWAFLAPALVVFGAFKFWPTGWGIWLSFHEVRPYLGNRWIGLHNFRRAFSDTLLHAAVWHTIIDALVTVTLSALLGFFLALLLEGPARTVRILRTAAFLPVVTAMVAVAELWGVLLFPGRYGAVNSVLGHLGFDPQPFLSSPHQSLAAVMLVQIWKSAPYDMVIFVAGLAGIDRQLYEAAHLDGAGAWQRLRHVTVPALRPITTIVITLGIIRGLRVFTEIYVLTNGGPAGSTEVVTTYGYKTAIVNNDAGYATAISTMLLVVTVLLTALFLWSRGRKEAT
jgi:multiple sugar transport system permease protein